VREKTEFGFIDSCSLDDCVFLNDLEVWCNVKQVIHIGPTVFFGKITEAKEKEFKFVSQTPR
jgi:hypothetical protein